MNVGSRKVSRRRFLRATGVGTVGLAGLWLVGCGDDDDEDSTPPAVTGNDDAAPADTGNDDAAPPTNDPNEQATAVDLGPAAQFDLVDGWYKGQAVEYYDFAMNTPLLGEGPEIPLANIYAFITGMDADGNPQFVAGQNNIIDVLPGDDGYSDLWEVQLAIVPDGYQANAIRSKADLEMWDLEMVTPGLLVNCPVVPQGSTLEGGEPLVQGWYRGEEVFYPDFGTISPALTIPIYAFITGFGDNGPLFLAGQNNIIDEIPGDADYSDFWEVNLVMVDDSYEPNSITTAAAVQSSGFEMIKPGLVVNCPVVPRA